MNFFIRTGFYSSTALMISWFAFKAHTRAVEETKIPAYDASHLAKNMPGEVCYLPYGAHISRETQTKRLDISNFSAKRYGDDIPAEYVMKKGYLFNPENQKFVKIPK